MKEIWQNQNKKKQIYSHIQEALTLFYQHDKYKNH